MLRDNVWGPQIDDAARRDFTVNAMYYDPLAELVVDYHNGLRDARKRVLRMIGDPLARYREDPVRIVRAVRFAAKLGFTIEPRTLEPIGEMARLLENVPASRLFDEMIKLLQTGHALRSVEELRKHGLIGAGRGVFPILDVVLGAAPAPRAQRRPTAASRWCSSRWPTPTAASPRASRWCRASCSPACCGATCRRAGSA